MGWDDDVTELIRQALYAQGFTPSSLGTTALFDILADMIFKDRATKGGSYTALQQEVEEAVRIAQKQGITPLPQAYMTKLAKKPEETKEEKPIMAYETKNGGVGGMLSGFGIDNLTSQASMALSALAFVATATGRRMLFASPALLVRLGIPGLIILEGIDLLTPGVDLPSPSDVPQAIWQLLKGTDSTMGDEGGGMLSNIDELIESVLGPLWPFGGNGRNGVYPSSSPFTVGQVIQTNQIVKTWEANKIWFAKQADGKMLVYKTDQTIKTWKPKKPLVVYPGGKVNLDTFTDIAKYAIKTAKTVDKVLRVLRPRAPRARRSGPGTAADGTNVTNVKN